MAVFTKPTGSDDRSDIKSTTNTGRASEWRMKATGVNWVERCWWRVERGKSYLKIPAHRVLSSGLARLFLAGAEFKITPQFARSVGLQFYERTVGRYVLCRLRLEFSTFLKQINLKLYWIYCREIALSSTPKVLPLYNQRWPVQEELSEIFKNTSRAAIFPSSSDCVCAAGLQTWWSVWRKFC